MVGLFGRRWGETIFTTFLAFFLISLPFGKDFFENFPIWSCLPSQVADLWGLGMVRGRGFVMHLEVMNFYSIFFNVFFWESSMIPHMYKEQTKCALIWSHIKQHQKKIEVWILWMVGRFQIKLVNSSVCFLKIRSWWCRWWLEMMWMYSPWNFNISPEALGLDDEFPFWGFWPPQTLVISAGRTWR